MTDLNERLQGYMNDREFPCPGGLYPDGDGTWHLRVSMREEDDDIWLPDDVAHALIGWKLLVWLAENDDKKHATIILDYKELRERPLEYLIDKYDAIRKAKP